MSVLPIPFPPIIIIPFSRDGTETLEFINGDFKKAFFPIKYAQRVLASFLPSPLFTFSSNCLPLKKLKAALKTS